MTGGKEKSKQDWKKSGLERAWWNHSDFGVRQAWLWISSCHVYISAFDKIFKRSFILLSHLWNGIIVLPKKFGWRWEHQIYIKYQRITAVKGEESKWKRKAGERKRKDVQKMKIKLIIMGQWKRVPFVQGLWSIGSFYISSKRYMMPTYAHVSLGRLVRR